MIRVGFIPGRVVPPAIDLGAATILSNRERLRELGIDLLLEETDNVDVVWCHWQYLSTTHRHLLSSGVPFIIDEERDSAQVAEDVRRATVEHSNIVGIAKPFVFRNKQDYKLLKRDESDYGHVAAEYFGGLYPGVAVSPGCDFRTRLLEVSVSYGALDRLRPLKEQAHDMGKLRKTDVHFRGWVYYEQSKEDAERRPHPPSAHRMRCVNAIHRLIGVRCTVSDERDLLPHEYWAELRDAKICLSPWGWATACHRDYEAILCGCTPLKPRSTQIVGYPDIYNPARPFTIECKPDFSDLQSTVAYVLSQWENDRSVRERHRATLINQSSPEAVTTHIASLIHRCLERS